MSLTRQRIEGLAPDQASLAAALKVVRHTPWPVLAASADASVQWDECQGSGATSYASRHRRMSATRAPARAGRFRASTSLRRWGFALTIPSGLKWRHLHRGSRGECAASARWGQAERERRSAQTRGRSAGRQLPAGCRSATDGAMRLWRASTTPAPTASAAAASPVLRRAKEGFPDRLPRTRAGRPARRVSAAWSTLRRA